MAEQNEVTYKIMVSSLFAASEKKIMEGLAHDLSKTRWKDSGRPMFEVVVLTDKNNEKLKSKLSDTLKMYELDFRH